MTELDQLNCELKGRNLIEASAGTGKTYAIASLYLRLVVETGLAPEDILVVTYTEAATEELRGRIRERIRRAGEVFAGGPGDDPFIAGLAAKAEGAGERGIALQRLERALYSFDTAAIFTIHGFCLRALQDNAFESGSPYDMELVTDQGPLLREVADDFWRMNFFGDSAPLLGLALRSGISPEGLAAFLKGMLTNPKVRVIPEFSPERINGIEDACRRGFESVGESWHKDRPAITRLLEGDKGLARKADAYRLDLLPTLFHGMDSYVAGTNPFDLFPGFDKFTTSGVAHGTKPTGTPPRHPFFDLCQGLMEMVGERLLALRYECLAFARERLPTRKRELGVRFFDDLLNDLWTALRGESGSRLALSLRERYRAALIDEFQDTDPVQYDIFRTIYSDPDAPLFLIGDPKQAIYSFRGADIFAYLEAVRDVEEKRRYTLTRNWRSTPLLLEAINTLFGGGPNPFVFADIGYHNVIPGRSGKGECRLTVGGEAAPLQIWRLPAGDDGVAPTVGRANLEFPEAVAAESARLIREGEEGKALIDGRPLQASDIAVIVRSHRQAGFVQKALSGLGIPSVMRSDMSIFATGEAREVLTLLEAMADPGNEGKVRGALVTDILGHKGDDIARFLEDESAWEERLDSFRAYHRSWLEQGFMVMFQSLLAMEGVRGRLLRRPDGERRVTNLLHCAEVIHQASHEREMGIEGTAAWFAGRIAAEEEAEEYQIRLETDEKAVKIVTVHVSKGLEYPVVFVPFMWGGVKGSDGVAAFHEGYDMVSDFGSPDFSRHRLLADREALAEGIRLLYVALTRAKFRCYLFAGKITDRSRRNRPETSPLAWLLHASEDTRKSDLPVEPMAAQVGALSAEVMVDQLRALAEKGGGSIAVGGVPEGGKAIPLSLDMDEGTELSCRSLRRAIRDDWRVASFTSFASHGRAASELPDRDEVPGGEGADAFIMEQAPPGEKSIFSFPRGAQAGIFLHSIFEGLDFADYYGDGLKPAIERGLDRFGYEREWLPHVCAMVENVVRLPLGSPGGTFTLADLQRGKWLTELEFYFPLRFITSDIMKDFLRRWGGGENEGADPRRLCTAMRFRPVEGMVRGFMDMVFEHGGRYYLVDWKSNHLGYRLEDYGGERLKEEMARKLYHLQYLLYSVALNGYLAKRVEGYDYDMHFGGVLYFFLRGVRKERGEGFGVFRDLPSSEMIRDLSERLIRAGG